MKIKQLVNDTVRKKQKYLNLLFTIKQNRTHDNILKFSFSNESSGICMRNDSKVGKQWYLVIIVICKVDNFLQRTAIRNTWGSELEQENTKLLFLVGRSNDDNTNNMIAEESQSFNDIVQVDIIDEYKNLTLKSIFMLEWLTKYCLNSNFYLKTDDDVYIIVKNLKREFRRIGDKKFFLCHVFKNSTVMKDETSKYYVSSREFSGDVYPTYCSGSAYAFPASVVPDLYQSAIQTKLFRMEDVYITGILAEKNDVKHIHCPRFRVYKKDIDICVFRFFSASHRISVKQMYESFDQLKHKNFTCRRF